MSSNAFDTRVNIAVFFALGVFGIFALLLSYFLAANAFMGVLLILALMGAITLPYHAPLSIHVAVATFTSALIVPFFPGRPFWWEFAALLGWSGLVITISMRRYAPDSGELFHKHRWIYLGVIGYSAVLLVTMFYRGFGLRILGSDLIGGRFYLQQLSCAIFPFLFTMCRVDERTLTRLFIAQCLLTTTYVVSDFVFSVAPRPLHFLLYFFELPGDAINFELQSRAVGGIRRFQSLSLFCVSFTILLLVFYSLREFFSKKALYLAPMALAVFGLGLLSGHRYMILILAITIVFVAFAQRFLNTRNSAIGLAVLTLALIPIYFKADRLPLAAQRSISFLPGIGVIPQAKEDGAGTMETRRLLRRVGMEMIPDYLWVGRGFGLHALSEFSSLWDPTGVTMHASQGRFFNGFIGLMVNMGVFGTAFMLLFLSAGTHLSWQNMILLRDHRWNDNFARSCAIVSGLWMANSVAFLFLHGDSEYALKTFSLQAGMLIVCHFWLTNRAATEAKAG